jgi:DNA-directed RNA polymerase specialized sigma24 family protein
MNENEWLAARFEERRGHLRAVAYRMLGSLTEADDAVQDTWLHLICLVLYGPVKLSAVNATPL